jgi:high affinity choline transporter 7
VSVVLGQARALSTAVTLCVVLGYTLVGGLHVVTITDFYQLGLWAVSMAVLLPCALASPATASIWARAQLEDGWVGGWTARVAHAPISCLLPDGSLDTDTLCGFVGACQLSCRGKTVSSYGDLTGQWIDRFATGVCAWSFSQVYAQRALAAEDERTARVMTLGAAALQVVACALCYLLGAIGASTDWAAVSADADAACTELPNLAVACVFRYLLPAPVRWLGVIGYVAAMMSSLDSCVLASSSLLTWNGFWAGTGRVPYRELSEVDRVSLRATLARVTRATMVLCAVCGITLALQSVEVDLLVYLAEDILFTLCTPPIAMVLCWTGTNAYGTSVALALATTLRCVSGEPRLGITEALRWPYYSALVPLGPAPSQSGQLFPFRTAIVALACVVSAAVSAATNVLFFRGTLPARWDALGILTQPMLREWARATGLDCGVTPPELARRRTHEVLEFDDEREQHAAIGSREGPKASSSWAAGAALATSSSGRLAPRDAFYGAPLSPQPRDPHVHVRVGDTARADGGARCWIATQIGDAVAPAGLHSPSATRVIRILSRSSSLELT